MGLYVSAIELVVRRRATYAALPRDVLRDL